MKVSLGGLILVLCVQRAALAGTQDFLAAVEQRAQAGQLTESQALLYPVYAALAPGRLPAEWRALLTEPLKCGTTLYLHAASHADKLSETERQILFQLGARPYLGPNAQSVVSLSGRFRIHYTTVGPDAISSDDFDRDGIPDYAWEAALAFDNSYHIQVEVLGYRPPPSDGGVDGPEYDVYLRDLNVYGQTTFENPIPQTPNNDYTSFIEVHHDFRGGFYTHGLDALRVTAAHELFHAVQFTYNYREQDEFFFEASSTWMEDVAYNDVNDYYQYLPRFFREISVAFNLRNGWHEYGLALWNHMLTKKFGPGVIRRVWEHSLEFPVLRSKETSPSAMESALAEQGSNFNDELLEFAIWNYFTGSRADNRYYDEATDYPVDLRFTGTFTFAADTALQATTGALSPNYFRFNDVRNGAEVVIIPVNLEIPGENFGHSEVKIEISRTNLGKLFTEVSPAFNVRLVVERYAVWRAAAVVAETGQSARVLRLNPIEPGFELLSDQTFSVRPNPFIIGQSGTCTIPVILSKPSDVECVILNSNGRVVRKFNRARRIEGLFFFNWDGRDNNGEFVSSDVYLFLVKTDRSVKTGKIAAIRR